jgi:hypothetical protein
MDAVTYPNKSVIEFLTRSMVPLQLSPGSPLSKEYRVTWTPTLLTLDWTGAEHYRTVGFLSPEDMVPALMLGCAKVYADLEMFEKAFGMLGLLLSTHPASAAAPEALFIRGICSYKNTHDPAKLKEAYEHLTEQYPHSQWTKRAYPYRLL